MTNHTTTTTEDHIKGLAQEALTYEGLDIWFPGLDADTFDPIATLATYLATHLDEWTPGGPDHAWEFTGDMDAIAAFAIERGAVAETDAE